MDEATGRKQKISTGCFRKSDALKYLQTHSLSIQPQVQPRSPLPLPIQTPVQYPPQRRDASPRHFLSEFKAEFASTNALSYSQETLQIYGRAFRSLVKVIGDVPFTDEPCGDRGVLQVSVPSAEEGVHGELGSVGARCAGRLNSIAPMPTLFSADSLTSSAPGNPLPGCLGDELAGAPAGSYIALRQNTGILLAAKGGDFCEPLDSGRG